MQLYWLTACLSASCCNLLLLWWKQINITWLPASPELRECHRNSRSGTQDSKQELGEEDLDIELKRIPNDRLTRIHLACVFSFSCPFLLIAREDGKEGILICLHFPKWQTYYEHRSGLLTLQGGKGFWFRKTLVQRLGMLIVENKVWGPFRSPGTTAPESWQGQK